MKQIEFDFPDKGRREAGRTQRETIQAMRDAKGDRVLAAHRLDISLNTLAKRLQSIRQAVAVAKATV